MNKPYSDSIFPLGIGASFVASLVILMVVGTVAGLLLADRIQLKQMGGIPLLAIFLVLLAGPLVFIRKRSRFEAGREIIEKLDGIGTIQGLRGAFFRLLVYADGLEIRAFYHRYFMPFEKIRSISVEDGQFHACLSLETGIAGLPDYIVSAGKPFKHLAGRIEKRWKQKPAGTD